MSKKIYGWAYDKSGNKKEVFAPVKVKTVIEKSPSLPNGTHLHKEVTIVKEQRPHTKTLTGSIPSSVGFSGFKS